jgi:hypothetical protein
MDELLPGVDLSFYSDEFRLIMPRTSCLRL